MPPESAIEQRQHNSEPYARNVHNPILHIRAAPKCRLNELYETFKGACPTKTGTSPIWPVRARGKARAVKAMRCTILSVPLGAGAAD